MLLGDGRVLSLENAPVGANFDQQLPLEFQIRVGEVNQKLL